jgi:hypothetical protein
MNAVRLKLQSEIYDLKSEMNMAAQEDGVSVYARRFAFFTDTEHGHGHVLYRNDPRSS